MSDANYKETLEVAETEMEALLGEQTQLEMRLSYVVGRINVLRKAVLSLSEVLGEELEAETVGITDAIRQVMKRDLEERGNFLSPIAIRNALKRDEFPLADYKNALAVIHTTLKRLDDQGEVETSPGSNGKTYYRWIKREVTDEDIPF